ncbi:hypothetical protein PN836_009355 [Ningiella sp. W23]|uniref:hypothetical protein n=1 Tax=Ningiella sp. W23 TaxID=3023715 RepID=UPI003757C45A
MHRIFGLLVLLLPSITLASDNQDEDWLKALKSDSFDSFMVADSVALPSSKKIFIEDVSVSFDKMWLRKFRNETGKRYQQRIQQRYALMLREHLEESLTAARWTLSNGPQQDALTLSAQFKDLDITGPQQSVKQHMLVRSVGKASIFLEVKGTDGKAFFTLEDRGDAGGLSGQLFETDPAMNYSMFSKLADTWASNFVAYLNITTETVMGQT